MQREYVLFAPTQDEFVRWLHYFKWVLELNMFNQFMINSPSFFKFMNITFDHFYDLDDSTR